jgi:hypothetical protein
MVSDPTLAKVPPHTSNLLIIIHSRVLTSHHQQYNVCRVKSSFTRCCFHDRFEALPHTMHSRARPSPSMRRYLLSRIASSILRQMMPPRVARLYPNSESGGAPVLWPDGRRHNSGAGHRIVVHKNLHPGHSTLEAGRFLVYVL